MNYAFIFVNYPVFPTRDHSKYAEQHSQKHRNCLDMPTCCRGFVHSYYIYSYGTVYSYVFPSFWLLPVHTHTYILWHGCYFPLSVIHMDERWHGWECVSGWVEQARAHQMERREIVCVCVLQLARIACHTEWQDQRHSSGGPVRGGGLICGCLCSQW